MPFDKEMQLALEADAEKLRQLTGKDHHVEFVDEDFCPLCGVCLPPEERCTSESFKGIICPHAEAASSYAQAHG